MGVYIEGMEMPKEGSWTTVRIYPDGTCAVPNWQGDCTLIKGAKAVHVPPHGRLIDGDKLAEEQKENVGAYHANLITLDDLAEFLLMQSISEDYAPTIIPADVPDNNVGNIPAEEGE